MGTLQWPTACFFDSDGDPLSGGKLYSYIAGTTTAKALYTDRDLTTPATNPVVLDSNGCTPELYGTGTYKLILKDSLDVTTYFEDDNVTVSDASGGATSFFYPDYNATDQGVTGDSNTIKYAVDTLSTDSGAIVLQHNSGSATTTYTLSTNEVIPSNINLIIEKGAILDGAAALQINSHFDPGEFQVFGTTITVTFGVNGTTDIHPEWWGTFPNGTNDTTILNKAIAASDLVGTTDGYADASIIVRPGRYYVAHSSVSTIKTNLHARNAAFIAVANTSLTGWLLRFDFSEANTFKTVDIGLIYGTSPLVDAAKYNVGFDIRGGDMGMVRIGGLSGLYIGIQSAGDSHGKHVGMWDIEVIQLLGCDYGVRAKAGDAVRAHFELNRIFINYVAYTERVIDFDSHTPSTNIITANHVRIGSMELNARDDYYGFWVTGDTTYSNKFIIDGNLIRPSGVGDIIHLTNDAYDNLFDLPYWDWTKIQVGGYNVFTSRNNNTVVPAYGVTNDIGRSELMGASFPAKASREGDRVWNNSPSDGIAAWINTVDGATPTASKIWSRPEETITAAGAAATVGLTKMDSTAGAMAITLADGTNVGQDKEFSFTTDGGDVTLTVEHHATEDDEVFTFTTGGAYLCLRWCGFDWVTIYAHGAAT